MNMFHRIAVGFAMPLLLAASADAQPAKPVRISQAFQSLLYLPLYVAKDAGFFDEEGVSVTIATGGGGSQSWSAVIGGSADYSIHDPVFPTVSREKGGPGVVVGTICNAETMYALAKKPEIKRTADARDLLTKGYKIATQPQPDSGWARVTQLANELKLEQGSKTFTNVQVPIGSEMAAVFAGQADIGLSYPPVVEQAEAKGLYIVYSFTAASRPYLFSSLNTTRDFIAKNPQAHQAVMNAFERASRVRLRLRRQDDRRRVGGARAGRRGPQGRLPVHRRRRRDDSAAQRHPAWRGDPSGAPAAWVALRRRRRSDATQARADAPGGLDARGDQRSGIGVRSRRRVSDRGRDRCAPAARRSSSTLRPS